MNQNRKPIDYAKASCETMMREIRGAGSAAQRTFPLSPGCFPFRGYIRHTGFVAMRDIFSISKTGWIPLSMRMGKYIP